MKKWFKDWHFHIGVLSSNSFLIGINFQQGVDAVDPTYTIDEISFGIAIITLTITKRIKGGE